MEYSNLSQEMNLPQSDFAEMAVLGSVLMEPGLLYEVSQVIKMEAVSYTHLTLPTRS